MHTLKWGPVPVKANPTMMELLQAIYEYLSTPLTKSDIKFILSTPQNSRNLEQARECRARNGFDAVYAVAIQSPFKRSDVLGSHRRFLGIRAAKIGDGTDRLYFNLGSGPVPRI
ncbi:hypothetical protein AN958_09513 [Leucoagaricus sp. SymC.cos]|nr:hypothetical protein AN958_09513 [Leucoagaricus sp. SymC.cos]